jgi:hypothetical protein
MRDSRIPLERGGSVLASRNLACNSTYLFCGNPFCLSDETGRACGARLVCVLRGRRLLSGDRRFRLWQNTRDSMART